MTPTRAAVRSALPALGSALIGLAVLLVDARAAQAFTPTSKGGGESTALDLSPSSGSTHTSSGGASIVRTIVGLLIVIAVIWGLTWILKQVKSSRETRSAGSGLSSLATLALGSGRTLHLVRAGNDYLLVGSAEHGVAPIHRYTEQQARDAGLLDLSAEGDGTEGDGRGGDGSSRRRALQIPGQARAARAPRVPGQGVPVLERLREWTVRR
ncbi:MAG TPA: flagellar biosynthetic protein FliO [Solirubrobacteraceae bacterium]|nr:flagellar biosynthetic protein FliO [Solirubrobacteraceae bacterium]